MQPVVQGFVLLQVPWQAKPLALVRNWRAESVPAQSTAVTNVASNIFLRFLFILLPHFQFAGPEVRTFPSGYFAGLAAMKLHVPESGKLGCAKTHAQPRMLAQAVLWVQKPRQVVWKGRYNW